MADNNWKCSKCGYTLKAELPPEQCPSCGQKCDFLNVNVYIPDIEGSDVDNRLG